ncbi:MAG: glycosyltransferase [Candidatus Omnitrophota bacterium]|nr:MAG: glycosyltransferase [Candidatus Omnitrophota bacterium]
MIKNRRPGLTFIFLLFTIIAILVYAVIRSTLLLFADYNPVEKIWAILLISGEFFILLHAMGYVLNIAKAKFKSQDIIVKQGGLNQKKPYVAILVPARHEPKEVLENTFISINNINYNNKKVYLLDDSTDEKYKQEAEELSKEYNLTLFRRTRPAHGAKAGIINDCLENLQEDYIAVFDADQNPLPDFLTITIPILEDDEKLAFIQTPQFYSNIESNPIARGATFQQAVFYEYICEGKSLSDSMFCCGTNVVLRREALMQIGGFDESTVTEDLATSIKLHTRGWKSLYYPHVYAFGMGPENLTAYFQQQFRWAAGTISVFKKILKQFLLKPFSLKTVQWFEYFLSSTYYFTGLALSILMLCPLLYLIFKIPSFFARPEIYLFSFLPYIILSMSIFYLVLRKRNYTPKDLFIGQLLGITAFSVYMRAAISALLGMSLSFGVTSKSKGTTIPYFRLWPQIGFILLNFIAIVWGVNRYIYELNPAILVNGFWAFYHMSVLSAIFYFNRELR